MRATRFRLTAGCLSWETKDGTAAKNQRILDLIPAEFKDPAVNSTKGWRDFNKQEVKIIKDGAMRKPQQGPKEKRAAQAAKERERTENAIQDSVEMGEILKSCPEIQHDGNDAWVGRPNHQDSSEWPESDPKSYEDSELAPQSYHKDPRSSKPRQSTSVLEKYPLTTTDIPSQQDSMQPRKRSRGTLNEDHEESGNNRASKRTRVTTGSDGLGNQGTCSRMGTSRMGRQQQRPAPAPAPAPSPYTAVNTSPAFTYPTLNSNVLRSTPHLLSSNATYSSSSPASAEPRHQVYPSSYSSNARSVLSNMYNSSHQPGPGDYYSFLQAPFTQNEGYNTSQLEISLEGNPLYRYAQPDAFQIDQANSWSLGHEPNENPGSNPLYGYVPLNAFQIDQANSWSIGHESSEAPGSNPIHEYAEPDIFQIDQANNWSLGHEPPETSGSWLSYGYAQPDALQLSQTYSQTFGPLYPNNGLNSGLDARANNGECYLPESDCSYQEFMPTPQQPGILLSTNLSAAQHPVGAELGIGINPALLTLASSESMY